MAAVEAVEQKLEKLALGETTVHSTDIDNNCKVNGDACGEICKDIRGAIRNCGSTIADEPTKATPITINMPPHETAAETAKKTSDDTSKELPTERPECEIAIPAHVHDEPELHELQTEWSLWLYTNNKSRRWEENLQHVISFKTVEEFWAVYNHIQLSSRLSPGHDYAIFRAGMRPAWEDEANKEGGRWMISLPAKHHRNKDLDRLWLELMLLIIGEDFQNSEESQLVNGAVVSIRFKDDRIALWTGDSKASTHQVAIGKQIKSRLNINSSLSFESHASQGNSKSKHKPAMYTV